jgi:hypothetical protein
VPRTVDSGASRSSCLRKTDTIAEDIVHPVTSRVVAARQVEEMHAVAGTARLARQAQDGGEPASRSTRGVGIGGRNARRKLLRRWVPGRPQSA